MAGENAALKEAAAAPQGVSVAMDKTHPALGVNRILDAEQGRVEFLMPDGVTPRKKIALVGFAASSRDMAPLDDPEWVVVGMNQLYRHLKSRKYKNHLNEAQDRHPDAWFEIHEAYMEAVVPGTDHEGWLRECGIPVFMTRTLPNLPTSVRFPIDRLISKFHDYFTSTVAHMVAWAVDYIDEKVEADLKKFAAKADSAATAWDAIRLAHELYGQWSIGVYGIDLVVGEEYTWQRPCAEFYLGQALARNIRVHIPKPSALLKQRYRYGYEMEPSDLLRDSDFERRRVQLVNQHQAVSDQMQRLIGAQEELKYLRELRDLRERGAEVGV